MPELFTPDPPRPPDAEDRLRAAGWSPYGYTRSGAPTGYWIKAGRVLKEDEALAELDRAPGTGAVDTDRQEGD